MRRVQWSFPQPGYLPFSQVTNTCLGLRNGGVFSRDLQGRLESEKLTYSKTAGWLVIHDDKTK
jgi:hypothetical protein